jgi:hypothetical protein
MDVKWIAYVSDSDIGPRWPREITPQVSQMATIQPSGSLPACDDSLRWSSGHFCAYWTHGWGML